MGLLETAAVGLTGVERRVEIAARNVANANTPGYKREVAYAEIADAAPSPATGVRSLPQTRSIRVLDQAVLTESGSPLDLAIDGAGFVLVRDGERLYPSRGGAFAMAADGRLVDATGRSLQQAGGGDLVVQAGKLTIHDDGTVLVDDMPMGAVGLYADAGRERAGLDEGLALAALGSLTEADEPVLRQGMLESANVTLSDEMVTLMQAQRLGEASAQIVRTYDQLLAQATSTFSRSGK